MLLTTKGDNTAAVFVDKLSSDRFLHNLFHLTTKKETKIVYTVGQCLTKKITSRLTIRSNLSINSLSVSTEAFVLSILILVLLAQLLHETERKWKRMSIENGNVSLTYGIIDWWLNLFVATEDNKTIYDPSQQLVILNSRNSGRAIWLSKQKQ